MSSTTFRVVTRGLQPGHPLETAADHLAALFNASTQQLAPVLAGQPVTVKRGLAYAAAAKYTQALAHCGCLSSIEAESEAHPGPAAPAPAPPHAAALLTLSKDRLRQLQPELFDAARCSDENRDRWLERIGRTLARGDSRAAVVVDAAHGIVASYTREFDCVVLLAFDPELGRAHGWQDGTRLLCAHGYTERDRGCAADLQPGQGGTGRFGNVWPLVADLLTDDHVRLVARKREIGDAEWARTGDAGRRLLADGHPARDGRPVRADRPAPMQPAPSPDDQAAAAGASHGTGRRRRLPHVTFGDSLRNMAIFGVCVGIGWGAGMQVTAMPHDGSFYMACLGIAVFGIFGLLCLRNTADYLRNA